MTSAVKQEAGWCLHWKNRFMMVDGKWWCCGSCICQVSCASSFKRWTCCSAIPLATAPHGPRSPFQGPASASWKGALSGRCSASLVSKGWWRSSAVALSRAPTAPEARVPLTEGSCPPSRTHCPHYTHHRWSLCGTSCVGAVTGCGCCCGPHANCTPAVGHLPSKHPPPPSACPPAPTVAACFPKNEALP